MGSPFSYLIFQIYSLIRTTTLSKDSLDNTISTTGRLQAMMCTMLQLIYLFRRICALPIVLFCTVLYNINIYVKGKNYEVQFKNR